MTETFLQDEKVYGAMSSQRFFIFQADLTSQDPRRQPDGHLPAAAVDADSTQQL